MGWCSTVVVMWCGMVGCTVESRIWRIRVWRLQSIATSLVFGDHKFAFGALFSTLHTLNCIWAAYSRLWRIFSHLKWCHDAPDGRKSAEMAKEKKCLKLVTTKGGAWTSTAGGPRTTPAGERAEQVCTAPLPRPE